MTEERPPIYPGEWLGEEEETEEQAVAGDAAIRMMAIHIFNGLGNSATELDLDKITILLGGMALVIRGVSDTVGEPPQVLLRALKDITMGLQRTH
jgi:hypothetical protein